MNGMNGRGVMTAARGTKRRKSRDGKLRDIEAKEKSLNEETSRVYKSSRRM